MGRRGKKAKALWTCGSVFLLPNKKTTKSDEHATKKVVISSFSVFFFFEVVLTSEVVRTARLRSHSHHAVQCVCVSSREVSLGSWLPTMRHFFKFQVRRGYLKL